MKAVPRTLLVALALLAPAGCKTCELVEAELRHQSNKVDELQTHLALRDAEVTTLQATVDSLRAELEQRGTTAPPETIYRSIGLARISLGSLTGGRDFDRNGTDDGLQVQIEPHDYDNDVFKCPGEASIELYQFEPSGAKKPIGRWQIDQAKLRSGWRVSLLGQGYQVVVPWQEQPTEKKLRVAVTFTTLDGRRFEAERDVVASIATSKPIGPVSAPDLLLEPDETGGHPEKVSATTPAIRRTAAWQRERPRELDGPPPWWRLPFQRPVPGVWGAEPDDVRPRGGFVPLPRPGRKSEQPVRLLAPIPQGGF